MASIIQTDFSGGWDPSSDILNGPKNQLLRMQNLKLDEKGSLTLIPGSSKMGVAGLQFTDAPHTVYSKIINGTLYRFETDVAGLTKVAIPTDFSSNLLFNGSLSQTAFGAAYNAVLMCSGNKRRKYIPSYSTTAVLLMGDSPPAAPSVTVNNPYTVDITGTPASYTAVVGTIAVSGSYIKLTGDATTLTGSANLNYGAAQDTTSLSSGSVGLDSDLFQMEFKVADPTQILSVTVNFRDNTDPTNYFEKTFNRNKTLTAPLSAKPTRGINSFHNTYFDISPLVASKLTCTRGDFEIVGRPQWNNIRQITVLITLANGVTDFYFDNVIFSGGTLGTLDGDIEYIQRFRGNTIPSYTMYSDISAITKVTCHSTSTHISPAAFSTVGLDGVQIYRRGGKLPKFYLVHDASNSTAFDDQLSDDAALAIGVVLDLNEVTLYSHPADDILELVGPFFNRWLYFTSKGVYITKDGNPEIYSQATGVLTPYGDTSETFLWAAKFGNSAILVGTTNDIYEITGTLAELPDGTIDVTIRPTGSKNPPINSAHASTANSLYYVASDGVRRVSAASNEPFWPQLDLLFKGKDRYGVIAPRIRGGNQDKFILAISKNELYLSLLDTNGLRKMWVYDLLKNYCYEFKSDDGGYAGPICLFTEEDGSLLAGFTDTNNKFIRVLNTGTLIDGTINPVINLRTKVFNADIPYNRKDSYTLKLRINTGGSGMEIKIYKDAAAVPISLGFVATATLLEKFIDISTLIGICKSYQLEITGNCPSFKLTDFSIEFGIRPDQLSFFRSTPTNYGTTSRKRVYEIPVAFDSQGSEVSMIPYIDGVGQTAKLLNSGALGKKTFNYTFNPPAVGTDFFYTLFLNSGTSLFEKFEEIQPRVIEVLPDPINSFTIPPSNLGSYARKRLIAYAFTIDTRANDVTFTPIIDGVSYATQIVNTNRKQTVIYYFISETIGIDVGGTLVSTNAITTPFEFYEVDLAECVSEKLPPSAKNYVIPSNNYGVANRKRIRTIPLVIDTHGNNVQYIPTIDNVDKTPAIFNTPRKQTVLYYFSTDAFGIDVGGTLFGAANFEFYGLLTPESVEVLPVAKMFDQLGPIDFLRSGNIKGFRTRLVAQGTLISYIVYVDDIARHSGTFTTSANVDKTYEIPWLEKFLNGTTCRIELSSSLPFHRFSAQIKASISGSSKLWSKLA